MSQVIIVSDDSISALTPGSWDMLPPDIQKIVLAQARVFFDEESTFPADIAEAIDMVRNGLGLATHEILTPGNHNE